MTGTHHQPHHLDPSRRRSTSWLIACAVLVVATIAIITAVLLNHHASTTNSAGHAAGQPKPETTSSPIAGSSAPTTGASAPSTSAASSPSDDATPLAHRASSSVRASTSAKTGTVTYVVKPGDNLFVIAQWFKMHGYGAIYERNKAVLGDNPSLIHPGQRITISGASMSTNS